MGARVRLGELVARAVEAKSAQDGETLRHKVRTLQLGEVNGRYDVVLRYDRSRGVRATRGSEDWGAWLDQALGREGPRAHEAAHQQHRDDELGRGRNPAHPSRQPA